MANGRKNLPSQGICLEIKRGIRDFVCAYHPALALWWWCGWGLGDVVSLECGLSICLFLSSDDSLTGAKDSNPLESLSISAPNWWSAVIVDGVGSGMLLNEVAWFIALIETIFKAYLDSGNHSSCVLISRVDSSVSVEPAECAWLGVDGRLVLMNRFHVFLRSSQI